MPGIESGVQNPLGRIDPASIIGRGADSSLNSAPATEALIRAFRDGQLGAAEIADRAMKRPAVEAAVQNATDPELVAARKAQELAASGQEQLKFQQATALAKIPAPIQQMQAELMKVGLATPTAPEKWTDADSAATVKNWSDVEDWKTQVAKATAQKEIAETKESVDTTTGQKTLISVSKASGTQLDRQAVDQLGNFFSTYGKNPKAWIAAGKPPATDLFPTTGGTATTATGAAGGGGGGAQMGPADVKGATEVQSKAGMFVARSIGANEVFKNLEARGFDPASAGNWTQELLIGPFAALKTSDKRSFDAAKNSWAQGLLRLESGAAISVKEEQWYLHTFFPRGLEPKVVQDQKAGMRANVEALATKLAETGHLDVTELLKIRTRAETLSDLSAKGAFSGAPSRRTAMHDGRQWNVDDSDPANPKLIGISGVAPATTKYVPPETLRPKKKPVVEPK